PAAKLYVPSAHRRRHVVEPDAAGVEMNRAIDGVERVGNREVADPAAGDRRAAGEPRLLQRTVDRGGQLCPARAADIAEEALEETEVGVTGGLERDPIVLQPDPARHPQPRAHA